MSQLVVGILSLFLWVFSVPFWSEVCIRAADFAAGKTCLETALCLKSDHGLGQFKTWFKGGLD